MSTVLIILAALAAVVAALELRRRIRKKSGRLPRQRVGSSSGLITERPSRQRRTSSSGPSSLANPLLLGLVLMLLVGWLVVAYLLPTTTNDLSTENGSSTEADSDPKISPQTQTLTLAGLLTQQSAPKADLPPAQPSKPSLPLLAQAAQGMTTTKSSLDKIGLMLSAVKKNPVPPRRPSVPPPATKPPQAPATSETNRRPPVVSAAPASPARPSGQSTLVSAAASPDGLATPATDPETGNEGNILSSRPEFTVHLSSFTEKDNADKYKTKLAGAGEISFITISEVDGRLWYRVMSGRFNTRANADAHGRDLKRRGLTANSGRFLIKTIE